MLVLRGSIEVAEFEPRQAVADARPPDLPCESEDPWSRVRREHRTLTSCAAALAVLALHIPLVAPTLWTYGVSRRLSERQYAGEPALQWVVVEDSSARAAMMRPPSLSAPTLERIDLADARPMLPAVPIPAADPESGQSASQPALGAIYGRYLGQIHARIDRAWLRPRTAIGAPIFQCRVQLDQDSGGRVLATTLVECNGGARWQLSLVHAIEAASPLPMPPAQATLVRHVLMTFRAMAYSPDESAQLYEPLRVVSAKEAAEARDAESRDAIQTLAEAARARTGKAMDLRIEGSKVEVEPDRH
jgi:TonB C terminal